MKLNVVFIASAVAVGTVALAAPTAFNKSALLEKRENPVAHATTSPTLLSRDQVDVKEKDALFPRNDEVLAAMVKDWGIEMPEAMDPRTRWPDDGDWHAEHPGLVNFKKIEWQDRGFKLKDFWDWYGADLAGNRPWRDLYLALYNAHTKLGHTHLS